MLLRAFRRDRRGAASASAAEFPGDTGAPIQPRRFGRVRVGDTRCSLGRVTNISGGGLRVLNRSMTLFKAGAQLIIRVEAGSEEWLEARVCVAWVRPAGIFRQEMGLEFVAIDEEARRSLLEMAHSAGCAGGFRLMAESERHDP